MTVKMLEYFKKAGSVLYDDPTVQAYCAALEKSYYDASTGLYKENEKCHIYDFDAIADRILAGDRTLLDDLVCYYKCNDKQNNTKVTESINAFHAVSSANTKSLSTIGTIDRGFSLDASNPDTITIDKDFPRDLKLDTDQAWSIRLIAKPTDVSMTANGVLFSTMTASTQTGIALLNGGYGSVTIIFIDTSYSNYWLITESHALSSTDFNDICATYDGSESSTGISLYINGVKSTSTIVDIGSVSNVYNGDLIIGDDPNNTYTVPFDGIVDEIGIWKAELTQSQVTNLYNSGEFSTYVYSVLLDYLAWQFKIYLWDRSSDPATKLSVLKQSLNFRGKIGTPWAVKEAIKMVAPPDESDFVTFPIVITEGTGGAFYNGTYDFDGTVNFDSNYSPFKFDVDIPQYTTPTTTDQALFLKAINSYKNARSWLNDLTYSPHYLHFGGNAELNIAIEDGAYFACEDNAATTNVIDSTGNFTATASKNTSLLHNASGKIDSCFDFSGGSNDRFSCDIDGGVPGSVLDYNIPWSISLWIYRISGGGIIVGTDASAASKGFRCECTTTQLFFYLKDTSSIYRRVVLPFAETSTWVHFLIGQDSTNSGAGTIAYKNMVQYTGTAYGGSMTSIISSYPVYFGGYPASTGINGYLDEIAFFPVAPTATMATNLYNSGSGLGY